MTPTYGELLRDWREGRGLSQRDLADQVGCDFTYLSKIETGAVEPPSDDLSRKIAEALRINADLLINQSGKVPREWNGVLEANPRLVQLLRLLAMRRYSADAYEQMRQVILAEIRHDPFFMRRPDGERLPGDPMTPR